MVSFSSSYKPTRYRYDNTAGCVINRLSLWSVELLWQFGLYLPHSCSLRLHFSLYGINQPCCLYNTKAISVASAFINYL